MDFLGVKSLSDHQLSCSSLLFSSTLSRNLYWQSCPEVRALALRFGDPGFKTMVEFVPGIPWFNFSAAFVNSQLACLRPVGILNSCC